MILYIPYVRRPNLGHSLTSHELPSCGGFETERLGRRGDGIAQYLHDRLILPPPQEIVINHELPVSILLD